MKKTLVLTNRALKIGGLTAAVLVILPLFLSLFIYLLLCFKANSLAQYALESANKNFTGQIKIERVSFSGQTLLAENIALNLDSGEKLASLDKLEFNFHFFRALKRLDYMAALGDLHLYGLQLAPEIDGNGQFNFAQLKSLKSKQQKVRWPWEKYFNRYEGTVSLENGSLFFRDWRRVDLCAQLDKLNFLISAAPERRADFSLSFIPVQKVNSFDPEKGKVELSGQILLDNSPNFDISLSLVNINLARLSDYYSLPKNVRLLGAELNGNLWAKCRASEWGKVAERLNYGGSIKIGGGSVILPSCQEPVADIAAEIELISGLASLKSFSAQFAGAWAQANGKVYIWNPSGQVKNWQGRVKIDAEVPELQLRRLNKALGLRLPINGQVSTEVNIEGALLNPGAKGKITSDKLVCSGQVVRHLDIDLSWKDKLLTVESLKARAAQGSIEGSGYALFEGKKPQLVLNLSGQGLSLQGISPIGGRVGQFKLALIGTPEAPFVYGEGSEVGGFSGPASMLESASAKFMLLGDTVSLNNVMASTSWGQASVPYASYNYKHPYLYAYMQTDNFTLPSLNVPAVGKIGGVVSGGAQVMGVPSKLSELSVCAYSRSSDLSVGSLQIRGLRGAVGLSNMNLYIPEMMGYAAGGNVAASGWIGLAGGSSNLSMRAYGVDIAPFAAAVNYDIPLKLNGIGDMGASWFSDGVSKKNWINLYLEGETEQPAEPNEAAAGSINTSASTLEKAAEQISTKLAYVDPDPAPTPVALAESSSKQTAISAAAEKIWGSVSPSSYSQTSEVYSVETSNLPVGTGSAKKDELQASLKDLSMAYAVAPAVIPFEEPNSYAAAVQGFVGQQGLGFVGWARDLALDGRKLTSDLALEGRVTGRLGVWGKPKDLSFSYFIAVSGSPLRLLDEHTLWMAGSGSLQGKHLSLQDNVLAWNYLPHAGWMSIPHLEGGVYAFLGPEMSPPLQQNGVLHSWLPKIGLAKVSGDIMLGQPLSYQLAAEAVDIDLGWLKEQTWLSQAATLLDGANITSGQANLYALVSSEHGVPRLMPGTWAYIPWFAAGEHSRSRLFSAAASLSSEVSFDVLQNGKPSLGAINFERVLVSNTPRDGRLLGSDGHLADYGNSGIPSGLVQAKGSINGGKAELNLKVNDWNSTQAMALLPSLSNYSSLLSGWLGTDNLDISFDSKRGLLDTLSMDGSVYFHGGHLILSDALVPIDRLSAQIHRSSDRLNFSNLKLKSGDLLFQGSGWRSSDGRLEANIYAEDVLLDSFSYFDPSLADLHGRADMAMCIESDDPSFRAIQAVFAMEGKDVTWGSVPVSLYFPDFRVGFLEKAEDGTLKTAEGLGVALRMQDGRFYADLPSESVKFSAYRFFEKSLLPKVVADRLGEEDSADKSELSSRSAFRPQPALNKSGEIIGARLDKEPVSLSIAGGFNFVPPVNSALGDWFTGPEGPEFGIGEVPLTFSLQNFQGNMARAALGLPVSQRRFSFSGELGLKGQWYRGHLAEAPAGSLRYSFDISQLAFGSVTIDEAENIEKAKSNRSSADEPPAPHRILWRGLTLKHNLQGAYSREAKAGRLIIEPFEFVPEHRSIGDKGREDGSYLSGSVSGSANLAITRMPSRGSGAKKTEATEVNELHLKVSQLPVSELGSFLWPNLNSGFVESFVLNASGPIYSPAFNMLFDVSMGRVGRLDLASITGAVSGRRDPQTKIYQVKLGTISDALSNERIKDIVSQGLPASDSSDYADGIKVYFGKEKSADRVFTVSGTLPYEVHRVKPKDTVSLSPFWEGTNASLDGAININAVLKDKDLGLISGMTDDIVSSAGNMLGHLHIGGTLLRPEIIGELKVDGGEIEHRKAGKISNLNIDADFSEINDPELTAKYSEEKKRIFIAEHGLGAVLSEKLNKQPQQDTPDEVDRSGGAVSSASSENAHFSRFDLRKFTGMLGDKPFVVKGRADMDGFTPMDVDFSVSGEQLPLQWGSLFEGRADVDLHLSKAQVDSQHLASWEESLRSGAARSLHYAKTNTENKLQTPKFYYLSGQISIPRGDLSIDVNTLTSSSEGGFDWNMLPVDYRINVNIGEDVWMHALGCRIRAAGELAVVPDQSTGKPVIDGEVDLSRGLLAVPLYDLKFKVRSGKAVFNHSQIPELQDVTADASVDDYEVTAFVSGAYPNIKVELVSNPPLAEKEIQNLLALGGFAKYRPSNSSAQIVHAPGNTTGSQAVSTDLDLSTSGISMLSKLLSSPLTQEISRMLFLSDFSLDITSPHGYSFKIAKSIDDKDRFLFTLTRSFNSQTGQDDSVYGVEWRFRTNMLLRLGFDQDGEVRPWFQGFWEF
ncbi:MAG: translocation/assembly module TamB domain-containing protein [Candidatus Bruticola sp.]